MSARTDTRSAATANPSRVVSLFAFAILGMVLVGGVGFLGSPTIHDAAHDVRHMLSFPCH
ncbi:CbtB domain-containing protein [Rhizobium sp. AB2/73]|uniref:CbtB domain-containing protein n=1 Tax=Rhizobium sp. AB2/73 TaxID=2795216 RepID=UPI000DDD2FF0|nr:CbtB domain-containing protein [Rhizobium sp. AB2/73]QYA17448.1 CbtB-domain containing protein [Rhizobium sp. AB2/73]UEQ85769.1 CbtB-domain containing protein [Rhizobium sp. AB2/73]